MNVRIAKLQKKDENKAIHDAIKGMHFDWYLDAKWMQNLYGRYFWYLETSRATQMFAAYADDALVGVILAEIKGEPKLNNSVWRKLYIRFIEMVQRIFFKDSVGVYDETNRKMLSQYLKTNTPDGEIIFLAADPDCGIKGVGSLLLAELERLENGKKVYLYTDNACTYQFYEHRGFERVGEEDIVLELDNKNVPLTCLLYSKIFEEKQK